VPDDGPRQKKRVERGIEEGYLSSPTVYALWERKVSTPVGLHIGHPQSDVRSQSQEYYNAKNGWAVFIIIQARGTPGA